MTRYDPFAYGEVHLDPNQQKEQQPQPPQDAEDMLFEPGEATKQGPPADANWAMLSEQESMEPAGSVDTQVAMDFGNDILGEEVESDPLYGDVPMAGEPSAYGCDDDLGASPEGMAPLSDLMSSDTGGDAAAFAMPQEPMGGQELIDCDVPPEMPAVAEPAAEAATEPAPKRGVADANPAGMRPVQRRQLPPPAVKPKGKNKKPPTGGIPRRRSGGGLAVVVPAVLCAGGGTAATWFWVMQNNPVMGGIIGAASLVLALFSRLLLRG